MENVLIRECTCDDIDEVYQLDAYWAQEDITHGFIPGSREEFIDSLNQFKSYFLVAEIDGRIIGYTNSSVHISKGLAVIPKGEQYLEIDNIYVKPEFRNRRVGRILIDSLLQVAAYNKIKRFLVHSATKDMDRILDFYRSHGFKTMVHPDV
ncbi:MAG: GNAT family N-acetyltransferase [Chloroflexi bacterium]|nr:GNAT family N-acetyltransferase [Chloroflexota bacterium]